MLYRIYRSNGGRCVAQTEVTHRGPRSRWEKIHLRPDRPYCQLPHEVSEHPASAAGRAQAGDCPLCARRLTRERGYLQYRYGPPGRSTELLLQAPNAAMFQYLTTCVTGRPYGDHFNRRIRVSNLRTYNGEEKPRLLNRL